VRAAASSPARPHSQHRPPPRPLACCYAPFPAPQARTVTARDLTTGREFQAPFDALVLAPGAQAIKPPLPGIDLPGIFQM
jgi:NADPH-dependent 2,4-dienoyl-CoA reductase/sulfur reductase-like enzyme